MNIEHELATIWSELLGAPLESINRESNFYSLGGNSMLVLSLQVAIENRLGFEFSMAELLADGNFGAVLDLASGRRHAD